MAIPKKPRKCRVCKSDFQPQRPLQNVCCPECGLIQAKAARAKAERIAGMADRKVIKVKLEKLKTARDWTKDAQIAFNSYIRARDSGLPCICCGKALGSNSEVGGAFDAGHYRSVGSAPHLRFDERNCHGQNKVCNRYGAGRAVDYRLGLIQRIGLGAVEALEADNEPRKWTIEELREIKRMYVEKTKSLLKRNG